MLNLKPLHARLAAMLAAAMIATAAPATAQPTGLETPGAALSRNIRVLASNPRDFNALIGAGRAALELGDVQAAAGFFGRAEEVNPIAPAAKAGLGAAMAHMGDADGAIFYFEQASRLGAPVMTIALDRGLARDLLGNIGAAQADYRLAIQALNSDEGRRRLALSLAIGRDRSGALAAIQPLLNRRDPAAQRTRAFVLALVGDQAGAAQAIEAVLPGGSARFAPFFRYLPDLSVTEKAAAVHLGIFPDNPQQRVAMAQAQQPPAGPPPSASGQSVRPAPTRPAPVQPAPVRQEPVKLATAEPRQSAPPEPSQAFTLPSSKTAAASPSFNLPSASGAAPTEKKQAPPERAPEPIEPAPVLAAAEQAAADGNLSGIDKLLATIAEAPQPPPAPQPKVETKKPADDKAAKKPADDKAAKAAAAKQAAEKKARDEKLAAEKKAREEAAKLGVKGTYWVQLAGGSNQDRMAAEYKKLSAKAGKLLKSRPGYVTEGKDYFRLVIGPFDSKAESQDFVNKLEKEGVDSFSWTRTPPKIKIEKLTSR